MQKVVVKSSIITTFVVHKCDIVCQSRAGATQKRDTTVARFLTATKQPSAFFTWIVPIDNIVRCKNGAFGQFKEPQRLLFYYLLLHLD
jgi:hypothetical protein